MNAICFIGLVNNENLLIFKFRTSKYDLKDNFDND